MNIFLSYCNNVSLLFYRSIKSKTPKMCDARKSILDGVQEISRPDSITPGTMTVHGTNPVEIMTNKEGQVLIGAGQLGRGRVVVFSHDWYTWLFINYPTTDAKLVQNVKSWLTYGFYKDDSEIQHLDNYDNFDDIPDTCKILVWVGMQEKSGIFYEKMKIWLRNGGGMVCGATPWGYLQLYPKSTLARLPLKNVLDMIDIQYTDLCMSGEGPFDVSENKAH